MARPQIIKACPWCGFEGAARERLAHECRREKRKAGRPEALRPCEHCGIEFSAAELQVHRCPRTRAELIAWLTEHAQPHRLHGEGSVPIPNRYGTWWCFVSMGKGEDGRRLRKKVSGKSQAEAEAKRDAFLRSLDAPELDHRELSNRSIDPLRGMYVRLVNERGGVAKG
jgi:hypothetical protein